MANVALLDLNMDGVDFDAAHEELLRLKRDRNGTRPSSDAWRKAIAAWANFMDDCVRALQRWTRDLETRVTAIESGGGDADTLQGATLEEVLRTTIAEVDGDPVMNADALLLDQATGLRLAADENNAILSIQLTATGHGSLAGGTTHANVVAGGAAGFMSGADKTLLDSVVASGLAIYPRIARDIDYTAEATATPTLAQTVSYGGVNHTWQLNTGGTQLSLADVLNGTGLRILYKSSGAGGLDVSDSTNTAGGVWAALGDLIPSHSEIHRYMYLWHFTPQGTWDSTDRASFMLQIASGVSLAGTPYEGVTARGRSGAITQNSNGSVQPVFAVMNGATQGLARSEITPTAGGTASRPVAYNVIGLKSEAGGDRFSVFAGVYSGGWPTLESLILIGVSPPSVGSNGDAAHHNLAITRAAVMVAGPAGAASPHGVHVHRLRVLDLGP